MKNTFIAFCPLWSSCSTCICKSLLLSPATRSPLWPPLCLYTAVTSGLRMISLVARRKLGQPFGNAPHSQRLTQYLGSKPHHCPGRQSLHSVRNYVVCSWFSVRFSRRPLPTVLQRPSSGLVVSGNLNVRCPGTRNQTSTQVAASCSKWTIFTLIISNHSLLFCFVLMGILIH